MFRDKHFKQNAQGRDGKIGCILVKVMFLYFVFEDKKCYSASDTR